MFRQKCCGQMAEAKAITDALDTDVVTFHAMVQASQMTDYYLVS